jgi:hypothetical protein
MFENKVLRRICGLTKGRKDGWKDVVTDTFIMKSFTICVLHLIN